MKQYLCPKCEKRLHLKPVSSSEPMLAICPSCGWRGSKKQGRDPKLLPATPKMPYVSIDIETTGLDPETCQTLEVGAVIDDWKTPIDQLQQFQRILIYKTVSGSPYAMALNANLLKQMTTPDGRFCQPEEVCQHFAAWLTVNGIDPLHVQAAGKNFANFDLQFLKRLRGFGQVLDFRHRVLDPTILFWKPEDTQLPDSKTCYERAGIDTTVAHTAVEDALAVVRLVRLGIRHLEGTRT